MKIYFIRNTNDENDNYRGDEYFDKTNFIKLFKTKSVSDEEYESLLRLDIEYQQKQLPFGVHVWYGSGEKYKLTFDEIYRRIMEMYMGGAMDGKRMEITVDYKHSIEGMLKSLSFMIEKKLIIVKLEDDGIDSPKFKI